MALTLVALALLVAGCGRPGSSDAGPTSTLPPASEVTITAPVVPTTGGAVGTTSTTTTTTTPSVPVPLPDIDEALDEFDELEDLLADL